MSQNSTLMFFLSGKQLFIWTYLLKKRPGRTKILISPVSNKILKIWDAFWVQINSPFRLVSLIYAEKFEFENPVIMEDKQCKQTERFSVMAKGNYYFLLLDDKSKQRYKVKINKIQQYDPYQMKKEDISKFPPV